MHVIQARSGVSVELKKALQEHGKDGGRGGRDSPLAPP